MTVDIVRADTTAIATLGGASDALARLGQWVEAARNAHQLVAPLVGTAFIPEAYKPKVDARATDKEKQAAYEVAVANATAAVLQGITLGLDPMTALQQIYVVHGRPGMYTKIKVALVQAAGHEVWTEDLTDTRAVVAGRRRGTENIERVTITMDQARKAGWTRNDNYGKTPQDMLYARAAGRVCDRIAPDALMGIASVEEIQDEIGTPSGNGNGNGTRTVAPRRRVQASVGGPPIAVEEPSLEPDGIDYAEASSPGRLNGVPDEPDPEPINAAQQKKLHALLRERGLSEREAGLTAISGILRRDIDSTKDLTKADATAVIDALLDAAEPELTPEGQ
jgi:hypothetical protein